LWEKLEDANKSGNAYDIKSFVQEQTQKTAGLRAVVRRWISHLR